VLRALPEPALRWLTNAVLPRSRFYCGGFNRVAARLRVEGVPSLAALVLGDLSLVPEIPEVVGVPPEELAAWRPAGRRSYRPATRLRYTGPLYAHLDLPLPPEVDRFLDRPGAPVVYVAITSSPPALVRHAVAALLTLEVRVLVAATVHDPDRLLDGLATGAAGDRVLVGGVLPSHLVMPRVALAVTAGGQGSTQTAMAAGTPLLGLPLQPEQDLNVVLLERQAAARRLAPRRVPTALAALAESMLADPAYRRAAGRIRDLYQRVDGPARTAEAIAGQ
jgi:UDP:flavonoid glycosyltransferase YjiC (YdhE family)